MNICSILDKIRCSLYFMWCPLSETKHYNRLKIRTLSSMTSVLDKHIMPYFSDIPLNKIPPATVRS